MIGLVVYALAIMITQPSSAEAIDKKSSNNYLAALEDQCSQMLCSDSNYNCFGIDCSQNGPLLHYGYCATFSENTKLLSMTSCPYFDPKGYNITSSQQILLPRNLSLLNDYMCGPLNREGLVCSECGDGFGPSVTSFGYRCVNCTDAWYGVPLFLFVTFAPITVFYFIVLIFQIKILSAPMPCFIMYAQLVALVFDSGHYYPSFTNSWNLTLDIKMMLTLYGIFNLNFGNQLNILPPYCLSKNLKFIHLAILGYISAFYPLLLIFFTWICVELHGCNFRPLVWLWRPFHRCFVRLRRGWDTKSDIVDVFATFFFLSYNKILYQTVLLMESKSVRHLNVSGSYFDTSYSQVDIRISYRSLYQLSLVILVILIATVCILLPPLILILYPIKRSRSCLSKCRILNSIAIQIFTDKVYSCYRDGLDGRRDMRSFSGLYFFVRVAAYLCALFSNIRESFLYINHWLAVGILLFFVAILIAVAKPYRKAYMNYWDIAILSHLAILFCLISLGSRDLLLVRILLSIPITVFILIIASKKLCDLLKLLIKLMQQNCCNCFRCRGDVEANRRLTINSLSETEPEAEPLIQPTSTIITSNYGAEANEAT